MIRPRSLVLTAIQFMMFGVVLSLPASAQVEKVVADAQGIT